MQKHLHFQMKKDKSSNMYILKHIWIVICCCAVLAGCGSISLTPSYFNDGYISVRKGDTLYSLSKRNNIAMRDLIQENNLKAPYNLRIGQKLRVPSPQTHTVKKGETLYSISRKYDMSISALSRINHLEEPYILKTGQILKVNANGSKTSYYSATKRNKTVRTKSEKTGYKEQVKQRKTINVPRSQSKKRFMWPVKGKVISAFGTTQKKKQNDGINISARKGTPVRAADAGTIGYAGNQLKGYGNLILIRHANGWMTAYAHNDKILVKKGQRVKKGQQIATVGRTGNISAPQLHFEIRYKTKVVNPKKYLQ